MSRKLISPFIAGIYFISGGLFLTVVFAFFLMPASNPKQQMRSAEIKFADLSGHLKKIIAQTDLTSPDNYSVSFKNETKANDGFSFYLLKNKKLIYWSDNEPAIDDSILIHLNDNQLVHLRNGDFISFLNRRDSITVAGLLLIKHSYDYENKYLVNEFNPAFGLPAGITISASGDTLHIPGHEKYYLVKNDNINSEQSTVVQILFFLIIILLSAAFYLFLCFLFLKKIAYGISFMLFSIILRMLMICFHFPSQLYRSALFSPVNYASSFFFNSLGDLLINLIILAVIALTFYEQARKHSRKILSSIIIFLPAAAITFTLIRGLIINSSISFELGRPEAINIYSIIGFACISLSLLTFLLIAAGVLRFFYTYQITGRQAIIAISVCALYGTFTLTTLNAEKENETRKLIAQKAVMRQDHVFEYVFSEQKKKISADKQISAIINSASSNDDALTSYISQRYFSGYLSRFELKVTSVNSTSQTADDSSRSVIALPENAVATGIESLYFLKNESGRSSYVAQIAVKKGDSIAEVINLEMSLRFLHAAKGFPELFIGGFQKNDLPSDDYSLARYASGSLVYEYGGYIYPLKNSEFPAAESEFTFFELNGFSHLAYRIDRSTYVIVSRPLSTATDFLTLFSWMFTLMSILAFIITLGSYSMRKTGWRLTLTRRVQSSVMFLVVLTFILVGSGTIYYINHKYRDDQGKIISDQVNALWFMISGNIYSGEENHIDSAKEHQQLDRLVANTNIDFNIYGSNGSVFYSSQPEIFNKGIISGRMNPSAYFKIKEHGLTQFVHPESAGRLRYLAGYAPFTDRQGNITGYLNIPYFEKQNELNKEVSVFLSALVNIYVLLFALAILLTVFITSQIAKPLLLIRERMSAMRLGEKNEKIGYADDDEIGQLVKEYNRMIDELGLSAEKLAQSERETAWREMARQVAHEIKNPLTPMKLSVQHLQRAYKEKANSDEGFVDRITATLIQQIDTLSNIATAFSNFAKMPQPVINQLDLKILLSDLTELYKESISIKILAEEETYFVLADHDQMIGVFSNLFKNAIQSISPERPGRIEVELTRRNGWITVRISDNGVGIPESQRDKIFIPNFTTKSSGMGLGLAIVKNIVEEASGKVWFTSTYGNGSDFFISLPEVM